MMLLTHFEAHPLLKQMYGRHVYLYSWNNEKEKIYTFVLVKILASKLKIIRFKLLYFMSLNSPINFY